jgi:hypothetical protein
MLHHINEDNYRIWVSLQAVLESERDMDGLQEDLDKTERHTSLFSHHQRIERIRT